MAYLTDLLFYRGNSLDLLTNDTIYGTADRDDVELHGGNDFFNDISGGNDFVWDVSAKGGGPSGNDVVSTGVGDDTVYTSLDSKNGYYGGIGEDKLDLTGSTSGARVDMAEGTAQNSAFGLVTQIVGFERIFASAYADIIYGDGSGNIISGSGGDDLIDGRAGNDRLYGNEDNDHVFGGDGHDTVRGSEGNDFVYGEAGVDYVYGDDGADRVSGGAGDDYVFGGANNDTMYGDADWDSMDGGTGSDLMFGGTGNDTMKGGDDNDTLEGGAGGDGLTGGGGIDKFVYRATAESLTGGYYDSITDFKHGLDKIDVSLIDARTANSGNQAFSFGGARSSFSAAGQIKTAFDAANNLTVVSFNTDNDGAAEMVIDLTGKVTLTAGDFVL